MTGKLLVAIVGLLLIIPNNGSPMPGNDKLNVNKTKKEESTKTGITSTEMSTDVISKSNDTSQSTTSLSNKTQPKKMAATTTEPGADKDEDLLYFTLRKDQKSNQMAYFNLPQPFYFVPSGYQPQLMQPQFMFNQPQMQMPFSYPMMFPPQPRPMHSMNTNNYMGLQLPLATFDNSNRFFAQQTYRQPFNMNIDHRNNKHSIWSLLHA